MKFLNKFLLTAFFLAVIYSIPILTKLDETKGYSASENRPLAEAPVLSAENVMDGTYFSGWEKYLSDHIYMRDDWLIAHTRYQLLSGHKVVRDVVITDSVLLPYVAYDAPNVWAEALAEEMADKYAALAEYTADYGGGFLYVNVPEQCSILRELYPAGMYNGGLKYDSENEAFRAAMENRGVNYLDMRDVFVASGNALRFYMATDHHYNMRGAFETYLAICDFLNLTPAAGAEFHTLENTFYGSRGRKIFNQTPFNDKLEYITFDPAVTFTRFDYGNPGAPVVYSLPASPEDIVAYTLYMGGDVAQTVIETGRPELPNVLIFGDSFTNALETVLYASCNTMVSLDLRHYTESLYEYLEAFKPDVVICLRDDTQTLSSDGNGRGW